MAPSYIIIVSFLSHHGSQKSNLHLSSQNFTIYLPINQQQFSKTLPANSIKSFIPNKIF